MLSAKGRHADVPTDRCLSPPSSRRAAGVVDTPVSRCAPWWWVRSCRTVDTPERRQDGRLLGTGAYSDSRDAGVPQRDDGSNGRHADMSRSGPRLDGRHAGTGGLRWSTRRRVANWADVWMVDTRICCRGQRVKGHWELPSGGHENGPVVATRSAQSWPPNRPAGQLKATTPLPVIAWDKRILSPLV